MTVSTYDSAYIYLEDEDYYQEPKEIFKFVKDYVDKHHPKNNNISLLDVGCAKGEFLYHMKSESVNIQLMAGVDLLPELISAAKNFEGLKGVDFFCKSADEYKISTKFNVITMIGLLAAMTDIKDVFSTASSHQESGDFLFVLSRFNDYDTDIYHRYRNTAKGKDFQDTVTYSKETVTKLLDKNNYDLIEDVRFNLPFDVEENLDDPMRSWTIKTENGVRFVNGLGLIFDLDMFICKKR